MAITNATITQCNTSGIILRFGYKKAAPNKAESGTADNIQYSKVCVALIKGMNTATTRYRNTKFQLLRACINCRLKFCCTKKKPTIVVMSTTMMATYDQLV